MKPVSRFGIDHLTDLAISPPNFVRLASDAGFSSVGLRIRPFAAQETAWAMTPGSPMLAETAQLVRDTGVGVHVVEIATIDPESRPEDFDWMLECAEVLQARQLLVMIRDKQLSRAMPKFTQLAQRAAQYGVRLLIEPMSYDTAVVNSLDLAVNIVSQCDAPKPGIILDALQLARIGTNISDVKRIDPKLLGYVQLCDAPLARPAEPYPIFDLPQNQSTAGGPTVMEARAFRLFPGQGELDPRDLVKAVPRDTLFALEAPHVYLHKYYSPEEVFRFGYRSMVETIEQARTLAQEVSI